MGGGGSSGGGSSSGRVAYPTYMETWHATWLANVATAVTTAQATSPFASAAAYNPATPITAMGTAITALDTAINAFETKADAYAPAANLAIIDGAVAAFEVKADAYPALAATPIAAIGTAITAFNTVVDALAYATDWAAAMAAAEVQVDSMIDDTYINADVAAFADIIDDQILNRVLPSFQGGMRDINAVMSSAFVVGESLIYAFRNRDVAKYNSELRMRLNMQRNELIARGASEMVESLLQRVMFERDVAALTVEHKKMEIITFERAVENEKVVAVLDIQAAGVALTTLEKVIGFEAQLADFEKVLAFYSIEKQRIAIVALKEQADTDITLDEADALWDLNTFSYGNNVLGSIAGGTSATPGATGGSKPNAVSSVIGGAMAGASIGTAITPGYGTAIGAVVGGVAGLISSM